MPMVASAALPTGTSRFGALRRRKDGSEVTHNGVDVYAPRGEDVTSPGAGTVMHANSDWTKGFGDYGRNVVIALDSGGELLAGHLDYVAVDAGERVERGEKIGTVGDTRFSDDNPTGRFLKSEPHVHIELLTGHSYPVRRDTPRQDPTALAFYDVSVPALPPLPSVPALPPSPSPPPKPVEAEAFATVEDAQQRADALLNRWNALINQASGPGASGRSDVPRHLQNAIISDRARFRKFITSPAFGLYGMYVPRQLGRFAGTHYNTLTRWYDKYNARARQVANALPAGEPLAANATPIALPRQYTGTELLESAARTGQAILFGLGVVTAIGVGWAFTRPGK